MTTLTPENSDIAVFSPIDCLNQLLRDEAQRTASMALNATPANESGMFMVYSADRTRCPQHVPLALA